MNPFAALAPAVRSLRQPQVRDLAWTIVSPPLLQDPTLPQRHPLQASAWAARPDDLLNWLLMQDAHPAVLLDWLAKRPVRRLGLYYERLWQFALLQAPGVELLAANLPVREAGRTLGEFDLLLADTEGCHHLELAVKFYLARSPLAGTDPADWLGPGSHDRLDLKLAQMRGPQLALSRTPQSRALLAERGLPQPQPALWLAGYLFQPWPLGCPPPEHAAPDHLKGHWLHWHDWSSLRDATRTGRWQCLPRQSWLATANLEEASLTEWAQEQAPAHATLLAHLVPGGDGRWEERQRVFVVPDQWPAPAD